MRVREEIRAEKKWRWQETWKKRNRRIKKEQ